MEGEGVDGSGHSFTAQSGDPYVFVSQIDFQNYVKSHNLLNYATFSTFTQTYPDNDPQAWVNFFWQNTQ
jgi:guanylate kinase